MEFEIYPVGSKELLAILKMCEIIISMSVTKALVAVRKVEDKEVRRPEAEWEVASGVWRRDHGQNKIT